MCRIAGIIGRTDAAALEGMLDRSGQGGPDDRGVMLGDGIALGHERLRTANTDKQMGCPLSNEDGTLWLVLDGELYNHRQLRDGLRQRHRFQTDQQAEVLLHLYEERGPAMVQELDGIFAFALYDKRKEQVLVARDPLGVKPFYYAQDGTGATLFASEIKSLVDHGPNLRTLPTGTYRIFGGEERRFWRLPPRSAWLDDPEAAMERIARHLEEAVRKRLSTPATTGLLLSGGLDSSLICSVATRVGAARYKSFATGMVGCADLRYARQVADYLGTDHHEFAYTAADLIEALPEVIYNLESFDPALVRGAIPTYFVGKLAANHVPVVLSGEGADELFAGYHYLKEFASRPQDLDRELREITMTMHHQGLQRVDRLTTAANLRARAPFLDQSLVTTAFAIHPDLKLRKDAERAEAMGLDTPWVEKWILRRVAEAYLPGDVVWRTKEKFAIGTGTGEILETYAESQISDEAFRQERRLPDGRLIASKEELLYWRIFRQWYSSEQIVAAMGRSRSLNQDEGYDATNKGA